MPIGAYPPQGPARHEIRVNQDPLGGGSELFRENRRRDSNPFLPEPADRRIRAASTARSTRPSSGASARAAHVRAPDDLRERDRRPLLAASRGGATVLAPGTEEVIGYGYIYSAKDDEHDAQVRSWVRGRPRGARSRAARGSVALARGALTARAAAVRAAAPLTARTPSAPQRRRPKSVRATAKVGARATITQSAASTSPKGAITWFSHPLSDARFINADKAKMTQSPRSPAIATLRAPGCAPAHDADRRRSEPIEQGNRCKRRTSCASCGARADTDPLTSELLHQLSYAAALDGMTSPRATNRPSTAAPWLPRVAGDPRVCGLPIERPVGCLTFGGPGRPSTRRASAAGASSELAKNSPETRPESLTSFRATNPSVERGKQRPWKCPPSAESCNAPERIRTSDLRFRRPTLYPAELRAQGRRSMVAASGEGGIRTRERAFRPLLA